MTTSVAWLNKQGLVCDYNIKTLDLHVLSCCLRCTYLPEATISIVPFVKQRMASTAAFILLFYGSCLLALSAAAPRKIESANRNYGRKWMAS